MKNCGAILIVLDLDDGCPKKEALQLAEEICLSVHIVLYDSSSLLAYAGHDTIDLLLTFDLRV